MSKWSRDPETQRERIERGKVVHEAHPDGVTLLEYLKHTNERLDYEVDT